MNEVPIVFCFDDNYARQATVAIASLLEASKVNTKYKIYCIVPGKYKHSNANRIRDVVNKRASLVFIHADGSLDNGYEIRGISSAAYYRFCIHTLLPTETKVIYSDVDVLFVGDLYDTYQTNLRNSFIGAVRSVTNFYAHDERLRTIEYWQREFGDIGNNYVNSGFLLMDLEAIRNSNLGSRWIDMSGGEYFYQDQDILNITCKNQIAFLPPALCRLTYIADKTYLDCKGKLFSEQEIYEVINNPIIIHYAGEKPWNYEKIEFADMWWSFVHRHTNLFYSFRLSLYKVKFGRLLRRLQHQFKIEFNKLIG